MVDYANIRKFRRGQIPQKSEDIPRFLEDFTRRVERDLSGPRRLDFTSSDIAIGSTSNVTRIDGDGRLSYPASTDETATIQFRVPFPLVDPIFRVYWNAGDANTGDVVFVLYYRVVTLDASPAAVTTIQSKTISMPASTAFKKTEYQLTGAFAENEIVIIRLTRLGTDGNDTYASTFRVQRVEVE